MQLNMHSLRTKLVIIGSTILIGSMALLSFVIHHYAYQYLTESISETTTSITSDYKNQIQAQLKSIMQHLNVAAEHPAVRAGTDQQAIKNGLLETFNRLNGQVNHLTYIDAKGQAIDTKNTVNDYSTREYFKKVMDTKENYVSKLLVSVVTNKQSVILCVPVLSDGRITGVLTASYPLDKVEDLVKDVSFGQSGYGFLCDETGITIAHGKSQDIVGKLNLMQKEIPAELNLPEKQMDDNLVSLFKNSIASPEPQEGIYQFTGETMEAMLQQIVLPGGNKWVLGLTAPEAEIGAKIATLNMIMWGITLFCFVLSVLLIAILSKKFTSPISHLHIAVDKVAHGDLGVEKLTYNARDELGLLTTNFNHMIDMLKSLIKDVGAQSEQLNASSEELNATSDEIATAVNHVAVLATELADNARQEADTVSGSADIIQSLLFNLDSVSEHSINVTEITTRTAKTADEGTRAIDSSIDQMHKIEQTVSESTQVVAKLGERSKEIGQIVETISGIAAQTNLLALNAAIEAARAGEQGRGFAVVAEEVRKLAEQSQVASKQIAELISGVQTDTNKAVLSMASGTQEVQIGTRDVASAHEIFVQISTAIKEVTAGIQSIHVSLSEMTANSQTISKAVSQVGELSKTSVKKTQSVSSSTEEQAASTQEIAASSRDLASMSQKLQKSISQFKF